MKPRAVRLSLAGLCLLVLTAASIATTFEVTTASGLSSAVGSARNGDIIDVHPGTYNMYSGIQLNYGVTLQGSTGNRNDVVIAGPGMNASNSVQFGIAVNTSNITLKGFTLENYAYNGIQIRGENGASNINITNITTQNMGERHIKCSWGQNTNILSRNVTIDGVNMIQTQAKTYGDTDYIAGIDGMGVSNWTIRNCTANGIKGGMGGARGAIFLWVYDDNPTIENNRISNCDRGICLGNPGSTGSATGGVVRNNFITLGADYGMELCYLRPDSLGNPTGIYNNTVLTNVFNPKALHFFDDATKPIVADIRNNIVRGIVYDDATADWSEAALNGMNNLVSTSPTTIPNAWFTNMTTCDLHLKPTATGAIDQGVVLSRVPRDIDGILRSGTPDLGADELGTPLAGDANNDGAIDGADYCIIADNYGHSGCHWENGDFNGDGVVNAADLAAWSANYAPPEGATVPEPACIMLLIPLVAGIVARRGRIGT